MMRDYENDRFKGFAYIEFRTRGDLERALTLNGVVSVIEIIRSIIEFYCYCCYGFFFFKFKRSFCGLNQI